MTIKWKIVLIVVSVSCTVLLLAASAFLAYDLIRHRHTAVIEISALADQVSLMAAPALAEGNTPEVERLLPLFVVKPQVRAVVFYDTYGKPSISYVPGGREFEALVSTSWQPGHTPLRSDDTLMLSRRLVHEDRILGWMHVYYELFENQERIRQYLRITAIILFSALLAAFLLSFTFQRVISEPLANVTDAATRIAREKDYSLRLSGEGKGEIGTLVQGFNSMLQTIHERDQALEEQREHLEKAVDERTSEISRTNLDLRREIEERQRIESDLKKLNEQLEERIEARTKAAEFHRALMTSLISSIPDIIFYKNMDGIYLGCNDAFTEFVGCATDQVVGRTDADLFDTETAARMTAYDQEVLDSRFPRVNEEWVSYPDGHRVFLETLRTLYYGPDRNVLGVVGIGRDITELMHAQEETRERERVLDSLFNVTGDSIALVDQHGEILAINTTAAAQYDLKPEQMRHKHLYDFMPAMLSRIRRTQIEEVFQTGMPSTFEDTHDTRSYFNSIYPVLNQESKVAQAAIFTRDVTENRKAEGELAEKRAQLVHSGRLAALGEMAAAIAHEIGQPLQIIRTSSGILKEDLASNNFDRNTLLGIVDKMLKQVERARKIIRNIRSFARADDEQALRIGVDLAMPVSDAVSFFQQEFKEQDILLLVDLEKGTPMIRGSYQKLEQVAVNLMSNARYAVDKRAAEHPAGYRKTVSIHITSAPDYGGTPATLLEIEDNGTGMTETEKKRCMEPFFTTKKMGDGTGLGLTILHGIVKELNGRIEIEDVEGGGTLFRVVFPQEERLNSENNGAPGSKGDV